MSTLRVVFTAFITALITAAPAIAQDWPSKPVRMIVGFPPGALPDVLARMVADRMTGTLHQPVIVENRPGAAGTIAGNLVARSPADGYTLLVGVAANLAVAPHLMASAQYVPTKDFAPIGLIQRSPYFIVAAMDLPVANLKELLAYAKANPGKLNFVTPGVGTPHHLTWELMMLQTGVKMVHVPVQAAQMITETVTGRAHLFMDSATSVMVANVKSGKLKMIGMTGEKRMADHPDVATAREQGLEGIVSHAYNGLVAPAGTPAAIVKRLNSELNAVLARPEIIERLRAEGVPTEQGVGSTPEQFGALIGTEYARWGKVIKEARITIN
jgi:tripartite-type tricarboxylate transporter receptor subunit TctC